MNFKKIKRHLFAVIMIFATASLLLAGCSTHDIYNNIDRVKEKIDLNSIESKFYEKKGGDSFTAGAWTNIWFTDMEVYDLLEERILNDPEFKCYESKNGRSCSVGVVTMNLGIAKEGMSNFDLRNEGSPYVYLNIKDTSGGR